MKVKATKEKGDKFSLSISCEFCSKPISKTSAFGMDCENDCAKKKFEELFK